MSTLSEKQAILDEMEQTMARLRPELVALRRTLDITPAWEQEELRKRERQIVAELGKCNRYEAISLEVRELVNQANGIIWEIGEVDQMIALLKRSPRQHPIVAYDLAENERRRVFLQGRLDAIGTPRELVVY